MSSDPCQVIICPSRYNMTDSHLGQMLRHPAGEFVDYTAYEKLADRWQAQREYIANVHDRLARTEEHLKAAIMAAEASRNLVKQLKDQRAALQAENERLRKAGDYMEEALMGSGCSECEGMYNSHEKAIDGWLAAKEGR